MEVKSDVHRVNKLQGSYTFRIEGYNGLPNSVGDIVKSPEFSLCGNTWKLWIYPGGDYKKPKGLFVSLFLQNTSSREVKVKYKLGLINQQLGKQNKIYASSDTELFEANDKNIPRGWPQFIEIETLKNPNSGFCVDDVVIFKVELTMYGELLPVVAAPHYTPVVPNSLNHCLQGLLTNGTATDVTFSFTNNTTDNDDGQQQQLLHAHKLVLMARSDVFTAMFTTHMSEAHTGLIHMDGTSDLTHSVLAEMLHYIYTDTFTSHTALATHSHGLLVAAHKYRVLGLMTTCEDYFISQLTDDNVVNTLLLADTHSVVKLRQRACEYIAEHAGRIKETDAWKDLDEEVKKTVSVLVVNALYENPDFTGGEPKRARRSYDSCVVM